MQVEKADVKQIEEILKKNYESEFNFKGYNVFTNKVGKIFLTSEYISHKLFRHAIIFGLQFGILKKRKRIQLTVEGSQMVGSTAKKNLAILKKEEIFRFMEGMSIRNFKPINCEMKNFVIITDGKDFFGSGIFRGRYIESLISKGRRIMTSLKKV